MEPLKNKTILVTRAAHQYKNTAPLISAYMAIPQSFPCMAMQAFPQHINDGLQQLEQVTDVLFTSANAVMFVQKQLLNTPKLQSLALRLQGKRVACVGGKTAAMLYELGVSVDLMPINGCNSQAGILALYKKQGLPQSLLFFRAEEGSDLLLVAFSSMKIPVLLVKTYRTICPDDTAESITLRQQLSRHAIDAVLLGSSQTAKNYAQRINNLTLANTPTIAAISPQAAQAAERVGLHVQAVATQPNFEAMLQALVALDHLKS